MCKAKLTTVERDALLDHHMGPIAEPHICPDCHGNGYVNTDMGAIQCGTCDSTGERAEANASPGPCPIGENCTCPVGGACVPI